MASAAAAANRSLGVDRGLPFPLTDLAGAQAVLLLGSNLAETMPPAVAHLSGPRAHGGLVVVDPRRSVTAGLTEGGQGLHLQPVPGTDLVVLLALLHVVLTEGREDAAYLAERTGGLEEVRRTAAAWWPERAEQVCGVPASTLRTAARLLADASPARGGGGAFVLTGRGVEQSRQGTADRHRRDQPRAGPRPARPGRQRLRRDHRSGQRPGRPGARPEVRPAPRLPDDRRPGRARARRRGVGRGAGVPAGQGEAGHGAAPLARHPGRPPGAARARVQPARQRAQRRPGRRPPRRARPARRVRPRPVRDGPRRRRRPPGHPVGGGGGHDDLARGPRAAPPARRPAAPRCPVGAVGLVRAGPPARGAGRPGAPTPPRCSTSSPAPAPGGGPTTAA